MKFFRNRPFVWCLFIFALSVFTFEFYGKKLSKTKSSKIERVEDMTKPEKITKSESEWKQILTEKQFHILRKAGTERPFGKEYDKFKKEGAGKYLCAGCDTELFTSSTKFDSKCGWPSFFDPANAKNINVFDDYHLGYKRTEVRCAVCDGHLGHVFSGEGFDTPTDKRYCINGAILKFVPLEKDQSKEAENNGSN